jgi:hypothetical protein
MKPLEVPRANEILLQQERASLKLTEDGDRQRLDTRSNPTRENPLIGDGEDQDKNCRKHDRQDRKELYWSIRIEE